MHYLPLQAEFAASILLMAVFLPISQNALLPPLAMKATAEVLTFGAEKYEPDNWKHVPDSKRRYFDAMQRHLWAWKEGEQNDPESGKNHLAHALCCLMFLYEHDIMYSVDDKS